MAKIIKASELPAPPPPWRPGTASAGHGHPREDPAAAADLLRGELQAARERGLAEGIRRAEQAYRAKLARLEQLIAQLEAERDEFFSRVEPELVRLAVAIAEKVVQRELETSPDLVVDLVKTMMKRLRDRETLRIRVNPRDLERVLEAKADLLQAVDGVRQLEVVDDRRVDPGGCVIESPNGTLDARIRTQFEEIERALQAAAPPTASRAPVAPSSEENADGSSALSHSDR